MGIGSCTCSSNRTHFLPIRQEFVFFARGGRKGLRYPGWDIVHVRSYTILEKWGGSILKPSFGGCFIKRPIFCAREMVFLCDEKENFLLQHYAHMCILEYEQCYCRNFHFSCKKDISDFQSAKNEVFSE